MRTIKKLIDSYNRKACRDNGPWRLWLDEFDSYPGWYRVYVEGFSGSSPVEFESVRDFRLWVRECL